MKHLGMERFYMNNSNNVVQESLRWLRFADDDLDVALHLIGGTLDAPRHACWLCQQAAEKALKAALVSESIHFPFTHDLHILRDLLPKGWIVRDTRQDMSTLIEWAIDARYPGESPEPTDEDAIKAESEARSILDSVEAEFKRRGMLI